MSDTSNTSFIFSVFENAHIDLTSFVHDLLCIVLVIVISLQVVFPFYGYVNRVNRERDKTVSVESAKASENLNFQTLVFPLIDHFYGMMKKTYVIYVFLYSMIIYIHVKVKQHINFDIQLLTEDNSAELFQAIRIPAVGVFLSVYILMIFTQVFQFFLTILAIQKFLLYFFPSSQKYIILSSKNMRYFIRFSYGLFIFKEVISIVLVIVSYGLAIKNPELYTPVENFDPIFFASQNISFSASALLYIPIMISVRKMSNLRTVQESKPQIYIFWQTATALVVKMIHMPLLLYYFFDSIKVVILFTRILDVLSVPVIIQISYLTCNRQNIVTLFSSFKGRKLIRELITPEVTSAVGPDPRRHLI